MQKDGKLVVAGGANYDLGIARYHSDGTLDTSFSDDGKLNAPGLGDTPVAVVTQDDGKILLLSPGSTVRGWDFCVQRFTKDGSVDTTYGDAGSAYINFGSWLGSGSWDRPSGMALQPNGKVVVVGNTIQDDGVRFAIARLNSKGTLDKSFSGDGKVSMLSFSSTLETPSDGASAVALQADGKIVVVGTALVNWRSTLAVVRLNKDGTLDSTFSGDGKATVQILEGNEGRAVAIAPDGKIVIAGGAGYTICNNPDDPDDCYGIVPVAVVRLLSNGALDSTFDQDGIATAEFDPTTDPSITSKDDTAAAVAIQADGKIVTVGTTAPQGTSDFGFTLFRFNTNGSLDKGFDSDGKVFTPFTGFGRAAIIQPKDGRIVVAGMNEFSVARYHAFACSGFAATRIGTPAAETLLGSPNDDVVHGLGGNDTIRGRGGNDALCGGSGNDSLFGGAGTDICDGGTNSASGIDHAIDCETVRNVP